MHNGHSLVVQWLGLCASTLRGMGSVLGQGTKILYTVHLGPPCTPLHKKKHNSLYFIKELYRTYSL